MEWRQKMNIQKPIRLYWAENYSDKPAEVEAAINTAVEQTKDKINLYPGSTYQVLTKLFSEQYGIDEDCITLGHGIEGLIHLTASSLLGDGKFGGMFQPSFFVFGENIDRYPGAIKYPVHYNQPVNFEDFNHKVKDTSLFFIASPSTATGNYLLTSEQIEALLVDYKGVLVVDECYYGLGDKTVIELTKKYKNLLVYRGFSKVMGLASLRIAFAIGDKDLIKRLRHNSSEIEMDPLSSFSINVAKEVLPFYDQMAIVTRKFYSDFAEFLKSKLPSIKLMPTLTTYVFVDMRESKIPTWQVMNRLTENGYIMSSAPLKDNSGLNFPEILEFSPPPREFWDDFAAKIGEALQ
jgi:histidinol-phosphate aminotransferase